MTWKEQKIKELIIYKDLIARNLKQNKEILKVKKKGLRFKNFQKFVEYFVDKDISISKVGTELTFAMIYDFEESLKVLFEIRKRLDCEEYLIILERITLTYDNAKDMLKDLSYKVMQFTIVKRENMNNILYFFMITDYQKGKILNEWKKEISIEDIEAEIKKKLER